MGTHFKEVCTGCDRIMNQCRCPSKDKEVRYSECNACKIKRADAMTEEKKG